MTIEFGRMSVLVDDCDEALEYYTNAFSLEVLVERDDAPAEGLSDRTKRVGPTHGDRR